MQILLSLVAIMALAGFAWALGFRADPVLDEARAMAEAQAVLPGFRPAQAALALDGRGAVVRGTDDSLAVIWPLADGWVARRLAPGAAQADGVSSLRIVLDEPMRDSITLQMAMPGPGWLRGRLT